MQPLHQSISHDTYQQLQQLRKQLSVFQTVSCRMTHEQVQELYEDTLTADADMEQLRVRRKGLCNIATRRNWLGCAHTIANDNLGRLADSVYDTGVLQTASPPSVAINAMAVKIYLMDHEKGTLEKRKALAQHLQQTAEVTTIQNTIQEIVTRHQAVMEELEQYRRNFMHQLDTVLEQYGSAV